MRLEYQDEISMGPMKIVFEEVDHTLVEDPNGNLFECLKGCSRSL